jgi:hypothetical protein
MLPKKIRTPKIFTGLIKYGVELVSTGDTCNGKQWLCSRVDEVAEVFTIYLICHRRADAQRSMHTQGIVDRSPTANSSPP